MTRLAAVVGAGWLLLAGCRLATTGAPALTSSHGGEGDSVPIRTSEAVYRVAGAGPEWQLGVVARYTNRGSVPVYMEHAGAKPPAFHVERLEAGVWRPAGSPVKVLVASPPTRLSPGDTRTDTLTLIVRNGPGNPGFTIEGIPGTFRLVYELYRTSTPEGVVSSLSDSLPIEERASNPFQITN
jgi:hypothetical protein